MHVYLALKFYFEKLKKIGLFDIPALWYGRYVEEKILMHSHPQNVQIYEGCTKHFC